MRKVELRTIEKISRYSDDTIREWKEKGYINWCGWKWWVNFSDIIELLFKNFEKFAWEKIQNLWADIERLCAEHDLDYEYKKWFYLSNYIFAKWVKNLIKSWTSTSERFVIFLIIFFLLNRFWKNFYKK